MVRASKDKPSSKKRTGASSQGKSPRDPKKGKTTSRSPSKAKQPAKAKARKAPSPKKPGVRGPAVGPARSGTNAVRPHDGSGLERQEPSQGTDDLVPLAAGSRGRRRSSTPMDLDFGVTESEGAPPLADDLTRRWTLRGEELLARLVEHGVERFEYRADLKEGRFVWLEPSGRVAAEARAHVLCSWSPATFVLSMAWGDASQRPSSVSRVSWARSEHDDTTEEAAWRLAMQAADSAGAEYLYRVPTPHAHYFLALNDLSFERSREAFVPATPVAFVLRGIEETRKAVRSGAEPSEVLRGRLLALGRSLVEQAQLAYKNTDWVAPLDRTGKSLLRLAERVPRGSYVGVLQGNATEWLDREVSTELGAALGHLTDEWRLFD